MFIILFYIITFFLIVQFTKKNSTRFQRELMYLIFVLGLIPITKVVIEGNRPLAVHHHLK